MKALIQIQKIAVFFLPSVVLAFSLGIPSGYTTEVEMPGMLNIAKPGEGSGAALQSLDTATLWDEMISDEIVLDTQTTRALLGARPEKKKTSIDQALHNIQKDFALQRAFSTSV